MRITKLTPDGSAVVNDAGGYVCLFFGADAERYASEFVERETDAKVKEPENKWRAPWRVDCAENWAFMVDCDGNAIAITNEIRQHIVRAVNFLAVAEKMPLENMLSVTESRGLSGVYTHLQRLRNELGADDAKSQESSPRLGMCQ